ncbi:MAG: hypothetical protein RsTaC01_0791 [Candidatus Paraimprobicoccus trichonymphae]|uniref:Uncharacterized protein n=1 Tax=Candidatus Paraimprobicoccus trichonymphae TaxID=3033793 RepID=A0AA48IHI3_9FIRM|nr:MAG: hypothetical protein RsTaC01_0791 [Candidatus Paraimprobicoccus trichonymphae]
MAIVSSEDQKIIKKLKNLEIVNGKIRISSNFSMRLSGCTCVEKTKFEKMDLGSRYLEESLDTKKKEMHLMSLSIKNNNLRITTEECGEILLINPKIFMHERNKFKILISDDKAGLLWWGKLEIIKVFKNKEIDNSYDVDLFDFFKGEGIIKRSNRRRKLL